MQFRSLPGLTRYEDARKLQLELLERRAADEIPDTVLFVEHSPVITRGRGLQWTSVPRERHMPVPERLPEGVEFEESERGGDLTWHGPGQLVIYPIVKLDGSGFGPARDVTGYLRKLERVVIDVLGSFGLAAGVRDEATGVWIGERKIASIGIAVRKWVTYHGVAINVVNDLRAFRLISPCGFAPEVMCRLADLSELPTSWRETVEVRLSATLRSRIPAKVGLASMPALPREAPGLPQGSRDAACQPNTVPPIASERASSSGFSR